MNNRTPQKRQINFGSTAKPELVKKVAGFFINGLDKVLKNGIGQDASNVINYLGKAVLPPLMILAGSKFIHEDKDSIKSSMLISPLDAVFTFGMALGFSAIANKFVAKAAAKGKLGNFFKSNAKRVNELKSLSTLGMTFLAIPVAARLLNWALPKVKKKIDGEEVSLNRNLFSDLYARELKPEFGHLTAGGRKNG